MGTLYIGDKPLISDDDKFPSGELTAEELEIQEKFNKVIAHISNVDVSEINTDEIFEKWKKHKWDFVKSFGGKLIYEYPEKVGFELDEAEKDRLKENFISTATADCSLALADFISSPNVDFFNNIVLQDYPLSDDEDAEVIPAGMKMVRAFKFFLTEGEWLKKWQDKASQIIQRNKMSGILCLSVHPLDYLSLSETTHKWRSCHALDGDYCAGNVSYMCDTTTVICYIKSEGGDNYILPRFPETVSWNSKKWRMLLYFSSYRDMLFNGREYPFPVVGAKEFIKDNIIEKFYNRKFTPWATETVTQALYKNKLYNLRYVYVPIAGELIDKTKLIRDVSSLHFNDLLFSNCYTPSYSFALSTNGAWFDLAIPIEHVGKHCIIPVGSDDDMMYTNTRSDTEFKVGAKIKCLKCNNNYLLIAGGTFFCHDCNYNMINEEVVRDPGDDVYHFWDQDEDLPF